MTNEFQEFVEYLRTQGVASFNIAFHAPSASTKTAETVEVWPNDPVAEKPTLKFDLPPVTFPEHSALEKALADLGTTQQVVPPVAPTAKPVEPQAKPEPTKPVDVRNVVGSAKPTTALPKDLYAAFEDVVTKDDGSDAAKSRKLELIGAMGLDDLLRINNDYLLGIDQDQPAEKFKAEIKECFA